MPDDKAEASNESLTGASQASNEDMMKGCLEHYDRISTIAHEWNNQVPQAIKAWYAAKARAPLPELQPCSAARELNLLWDGKVPSDPAKAIATMLGKLDDADKETFNWLAAGFRQIGANWAEARVPLSAIGLNAAPQVPDSARAGAQAEGAVSRQGEPLSAPTAVAAPAVAAPTPRTDEIDALRMGLDGMNLYRSLARQLERELAGAKATIERQATAIEGWKADLAEARSASGTRRARCVPHPCGKESSENGRQGNLLQPRNERTEKAVTDLEITKLCAGAMGYAECWFNDGECRVRTVGESFSEIYDPLHDDAQAMALVKRFTLHVSPNTLLFEWHVQRAEGGLLRDKVCVSKDLNRAICECVAKMQAQR